MRAGPDRLAAGVARHDIVRGAARCRGAGAGTMSSPARPGERLVRVLSSLGFRVEEAPGDGSDFVEDLQRVFGARGVDGTGSNKELQVGVDLFG